MNVSLECEAPFIFKREKQCDFTVYEYYEPYTYYLRLVSTVLDVTIILISFLKTNKSQCLIIRNTSVRYFSNKRKHFFKYNLLTILFLLIGTIFHTHFSREKKFSLCCLYVNMLLFWNIYFSSNVERNSRII
eukprot:snap_masked-scaffold_28-processed-gene-1.8-mRNA-1 protein AED:1.00 eAED:1.00 QI:0/0/0/0/1/1/3/0/131